MVVTTTSAVHLLRGTPDDHQYEDLRVGVGPKCSCAVKYWPLAGVVAWIDARGQVWQTNGQQFGRLDFPLPAYDYSYVGADDAVGVLDEYLVVTRAGRTFALRLQAEGDAAWTELNAPYSNGFVSYAGSLYFRTPQGLMRWAPEVVSRRGMQGSTPLTSEVVTRTLATEDPHRTGFWHRYGLRAKGGQLLQTATKAGPYRSSAASLVQVGPTMGAERDLAVWPGHGPSTEASFAFTGQGDITYESASVWVHDGRGSR
jgi:hypothetical protein